MSWDEAFTSRYDDWSVDMTEDIPFYVKLAREAGGPLVELAVGSGRVAIPVARATGRAVTGIDSSPGMLEQARVRAAEVGVELDRREGDMRDLTLDEPAALIYARTGHSFTCRRGRTGGVRSSVLRRHCVPAAGSPGTPSRSTTR